MDAPPIQYARTEDGVNIAYWALGAGRGTAARSSRPGIVWSRRDGVGDPRAAHVV